jgi:hypothetical protein
MVFSWLIVLAYRSIRIIVRSPWPPPKNVVHCEAVSSRSPSLKLVLVAVAAWVVLVTILHATINRRGPLIPTAAARSLQVGGLPVT